jgi:hypothetical protein
MKYYSNIELLILWITYKYTVKITYLDYFNINLKKLLNTRIRLKNNQIKVKTITRFH